MLSILVGLVFVFLLYVFARAFHGRPGQGADWDPGYPAPFASEGGSCNPDATDSAAACDPDPDDDSDSDTGGDCGSDDAGGD